MLRLINWISFSTLRREKEAAESETQSIDQIIMSAFEERAPLLSSSSSSEQHEKILLSPRKKSSTSVKKKNNNASASSWTTKSVMIGTTALVFGAAVMSTQQQRSTFTIGGGEDVEGNLGATTGEMSSSTVSDMITLTLGCTSKATLGLLPFPNGGFVGKVGAKLSLKSKDHNFGFQHAVAMTEVGCGTYVVSHKLEEGEQFGFYLYDVKNETNYLSDIGAQAIHGGPISDAARNAAAWSAESELANEENASDEKKLEDGIDDIASQQAVKTDAKAVAYAGKHGFIDADGNFVTPPTAENAKAFEDAQTKGWWPEFESKTDSATGVTKMNYVDWGGWLKWLIHGPDHTTTEIECDAAAQTCTLQKCEGWECTDYTMPCTEGGRGCSTAADFTNQVASLGGKKVSVRKYDKRKEVANAKAKLEYNNDNNDNDNNNVLQKRNLLWKQTTSSVRAVPSLGLGKAYPTRVIVNMAQCTKEKSFGKGDMSGVEFYPRTKDGSNAGNVYLFGQCYNMRDTATCEVPTDHHPSGCPAAPGAAPNTAPNMAQQHANEHVSKTTPASPTASTTSANNKNAAATPTSTSTSTTTSATPAAPKNPLTDDNIHVAVAACLAVDPIHGDCPDEEWGKMSTWNTKKVTNMDKLFYDPPRADINDHLSSFNGVIGNWDVSSVTSMSRMFKDADAFTGRDFYKWDTSKVQDMSGMFEHATTFNAKIGGWDVSSVKKMNVMFQNAFSFNQDLSSWDVSSCTDFTRMFAGTLDKGMDKDISMWNVKNGARQSNITYESFAFQAKFTCATEDDGPINSCKPKSSSEKAASAKLAKAKSAKVSREQATREAREYDAAMDSKEKSWLKPSTWFSH